VIKDITIDNNLRAILGDAKAGNPAAGKADGPDFSEVLKETISEVNSLQKEAEVASNELLQGNNTVHGTMIAMEKADLSFRYMMQVRNKIMDAYQEVMRMQV